MEFCGAGSLQDIYQGERRGPGIQAAPPLQSTSPVSVFESPGTALLVHISCRELLPWAWAWPG